MKNADSKISKFPSEIVQMIVNNIVDPDILTLQINEHWTFYAPLVFREYSRKYKNIDCFVSWHLQDILKTPEIAKYVEYLYIGPDNEQVAHLMSMKFPNLKGVRFSYMLEQPKEAFKQFFLQNKTYQKLELYDLNEKDGIEVAQIPILSHLSLNDWNPIAPKLLKNQVELREGSPNFIPLSVYDGPVDEEIAKYLGRLQVDTVFLMDINGNIFQLLEILNSSKSVQTVSQNCQNYQNISGNSDLDLLNAPTKMTYVNIDVALKSNEDKEKLWNEAESNTNSIMERLFLPSISTIREFHIFFYDSNRPPISLFKSLPSDLIWWNMRNFRTDIVCCPLDFCEFAPRMPNLEGLDIRFCKSSALRLRIDFEVQTIRRLPRLKSFALHGGKYYNEDDLCYIRKQIAERKIDDMLSINLHEYESKADDLKKERRKQ